MLRHGVVEKIDVAKAKAFVKNNIARLINENLVTVLVLDALKEWEGKQITRRLATKVKAVLPKYSVNYVKDTYKYCDNAAKIHVWGNGISYADKVVVTLCDSIAAPYSDTIAREKNKWALDYALIKIKQYKKGLKTITTKINVYNRVAANLVKQMDVLSDMGIPTHVGGFR